MELTLERSSKVNGVCASHLSSWQTDFQSPLGHFKDIWMVGLDHQHFLRLI